MTECRPTPGNSRSSSVDQYSTHNHKKRHNSVEERDILYKKKRKYDSNESVDSDDSSSSSSSSSSGSSISSSLSSERGRKNSKKRKKKLKKKEKKLRKKKKLKKKKLKKKIKEKYKKEKPKSKSKEEEEEEESMVGPIPLPGSQEIPDASKRMAPMTREEWEKKQSIIRRVYDEATGRHRLIKGDGEVLEEIVSKQRHQEINRQATQGDGTSFQNELASKLGQKTLNNKLFS